MERDALDAYPDALLAALVYAACLVSPRRHGVAGALLAAATAVLVRRAALTRSSPRWAMNAALMCGLASPIFSLGARGSSAYGYAAFGGALGMLGLLTEGLVWPAVSGVGFGLSWAARPEGALFVAAAALYYAVHQRSRLLPFLIGAALAAGVSRAAHLHAAVPSSLPGGLRLELLLAGLLSPARGLSLYFPAAAFGAWGLITASRDPRARWAPYLAAACAATWVYCAVRSSWTAGDAFGTPGFALVAVVLSAACAGLEAEVLSAPRLRRAWALAFALGFLVHASGAYLRRPGDGATLIDQEESLWTPASFPLAAPFGGEGPLRETPQPWRSVYALTLLGLIGGGAGWWGLRRLDRDAAR